jgi:hypothetical protein
VVRTGALAVVALLALAPAAAAQPGGGARTEIPDYDPYSSAWNGLAAFVGLAGGMGYEVKPMAALQWDDVGAEDILVLLYPLRRVDPDRVDAFVRAGGHVIIADDFGDSRDAITRFQMLRAEVTAPAADRYHEGRTFAPVARTLAPGHPIATQIKDVVTNHPATLGRIEGATAVIGFSADQAIVVAGERGTGRFVVVSDPSVLINLMQEFEGNAQLAANMLRWLDRRGRARSVVIVRGDVPMYGDPKPFIDDAGAGRFGRAVSDLNEWLGSRQAWMLTPVAMRVIAAVMALVLVTLVVLAMPFRRQASADGSWLRFLRPGRRDAPDKLIAAAETGAESMLVAASVLRDVTQAALARTVDRADPLYTMSEAELVRAVRSARGPAAADQVARVYKRLRALPSRSQAAAPWGGGELPRRDFDRLYTDVAELCQTLGEEI